VTPKPVIAFDFDGTLVDTFAVALAIFNDLAAEFGHQPVTDPGLARLTPTRQFFRQHGVRPWRARRLARTVLDEMARRKDTIRAVPGLATILHDLQSSGYRLGIVSSNREAHIQERLAAHGMGSLFDFLVVSPRIFGKARLLKRLARDQHLLPAQLTYVGDELRDMEAAGVAGVKAIGVTWGFHARELLQTATPPPHTICETPAALRTALEGIP
jgi:phosphoglycolate phosphatase